MISHHVYTTVFAHAYTILKILLKDNYKLFLNTFQIIEISTEIWKIISLNFGISTNDPYLNCT